MSFSTFLLIFILFMTTQYPEYTVLYDKGYDACVKELTTLKEPRIMKIVDKEHYDLIAMFEKSFSHVRKNKEDKELWKKGHVYQNGEVNQLFLAYRLGYSYGKTLGD